MDVVGLGGPHADGLITPPVGMNLFIIHSIAPEIPITATYRGVAPFALSDIIRVGTLLGFPPITLWLVRIMFSQESLPHRGSPTTPS